MTGILDRLTAFVGTEIDLRNDAEIVSEVFAELAVNPPDAFRQFHTRYAGQSGSQTVPYELSDLLEDPWSVKNGTLQARQGLGLPKNFLILSPVLGGAVLAYDTESDAVYDVDLESGLDEMIKGNLQPRWISFESFLEEYFFG